MNDIKMLQIAKRKKESRDIVKQILDFGVTEEQKIDIMFNIALTIENNETMKEVTSTLKKFIENINKDEEVTNNNERARLIIWRRIKWVNYKNWLKNLKYYKP